MADRTIVVFDPTARQERREGSTAEAAKRREAMGNGHAIERLMQGAIDFHVHAAPDPYHERLLDALELALRAKDAGMRAVVAKNHQYGTAPLALLVNKMVPGFTLVGSLTLNREAGGPNPEVVRAAARAGARVVWMPTISSVVNARGNTGIPLIDREKKLLPDVFGIIEIIRDNGMVLATGHASRDEIYALVSAAKEMAAKAIVTHPLSKGFGYQCTLREQQQLASMGALIEHCFVACMPVLRKAGPKDHGRAHKGGRGRSLHLEHRLRPAHKPFPSGRLPHDDRRDARIRPLGGGD